MNNNRYSIFKDAKEDEEEEDFESINNDSDEKSPAKSFNAEKLSTDNIEKIA